MAAPPSDKNVPQTEFEVPEGWVLGTKPNRKGQIVKYYTNIHGQKYYSESDLMLYIKYSKERGLSIYDPDFKPPVTGPYAMPSRLKVQAASTSTAEQYSVLTPKTEVRVKPGKKNKAESHHVAECASAPLGGAQDLDDNEVQCLSALLEISGQAPENVVRRASRRVAGLEPELRIEFNFDRAFEYIIKDKPLR